MSRSRHGGKNMRKTEGDRLKNLFLIPSTISLSSALSLKTEE